MIKTDIQISLFLLAASLAVIFAGVATTTLGS